MRKIAFVIAVAAMLLATVPSQGEASLFGLGGYTPASLEEFVYWLRGDQVALVTAGNLRMIDNLAGQLRRAEIRSYAGRSVWGFEDEGRFYPFNEDDHGRPGKHINWGRATGLGVTCGTIAGELKDSWKAAGIGFAACFAGSAIVDKIRNHGGDKDKDRGQVATPPVAPRFPEYRAEGGPVTCVGDDCEVLENTSLDRLYVTITDEAGNIITNGVIRWDRYRVLGGRKIRIPYIQRGWVLKGDFDVHFTDDDHINGGTDECRQILNRVPGRGWVTTSRCAASAAR